MASCFREAGDEFLEDDLELGRHEPRSMVKANVWKWVEWQKWGVPIQGAKLLVEEGWC